MMSDKYIIPCEMIRDLLPSYVDELTSDITNEKINEHISECEDCKRVLDSMRTPYSRDEGNAVELDTTELDTIDFLKKTKKRNLQAVIIGMISVAVIVLAIFAGIRYLIGFETKIDHDSWTVSVENKTIELGCKPADDRYKVKAYDVEEQDGVVKINYRVVYDSFMNSSDNSMIFTCKDNSTIKEVWVDNELIWANGKAVSSTAWDVYRASHPYIGDASANAVTANALKVSNRYGTFTNELETSGERMVWRIIFDEKSSGKKYNSTQLKAVGHAMIATIDNLDEVEFKWYTIDQDGNADGSFSTVTANKEDKLDYTEKSVKEIGSSAADLAELLDNYGIYN